MAEQVRIKVIIDPTGAKKGSKQTKEYLLDIGDAAEKTGKQTKQMGLGTVTAGNLMATAYAEVAQRAVQVLKQTRDLAFSVEETGSKFRTVLADGVGQANRFLEENARLMGITTTEGQEYVSTSVQIAKGLGLQEDAAVDFGLEWTKLAGDFQSFFNVPFEEGFGAIRSGLVGETEPLKRFGIVIREAEVAERALLETGKEHTDQLTEAEKVQARYNLIVEQAGVAVGDLERTQQSAANQTRRMQAAYREIAEQLSSKTLPVWENMAVAGLGVAEAVLAMLEPTNQISRSYRQAATQVETFRENSLPLLDQYDTLTSKTELTTAEQQKLDGIIKSLTQNLPLATQEFDKYGNAIGVNTEKARAYYEQLKTIEKAKNAEEIDRITKSLAQQIPVGENLKNIFEDYEGYQQRTREQAIRGARESILSLGQVAERRSEVNAQILLGLNSLKDLGWTREELNKTYSDAIELTGWLYDESADLTEETSRLNDTLTWSIALMNGDMIEALDRLVNREQSLSDEQKRLKERLEELLNVQGEWTQAQADEAVETDKRIRQIESERQARERLLELMRNGAPEKPSTPATQPVERIIEDVDISSSPELDTSTLVDGPSLEQLYQTRETLEQQLTQTTSNEERKRLLERLQTQDEYISAAEQGITHEEFLRNQAHERRIAQALEYADVVSQGFQQMMQLQNMASQNQIDKTQQEKESALAAIDAKLQNEQLSEQQRQALITQRENAEQKYQEKIDKLKREQFERDRKAKLAEIAMNTAVAVAKIWSQTGLAAIITQGLAIAMGVGQAAMVAKQPNPYLQGGLVEERLKTGRTSPGEKLISVNENGRPEFIMNAASTARSLPLLNRMNRDPQFAGRMSTMLDERTITASAQPRGLAADPGSQVMNRLDSTISRLTQVLDRGIVARTAITKIDDAQDRLNQKRKALGNA
jgi:hypothetical protein